jgi:hypothetical protein
MRIRPITTASAMRQRAAGQRGAGPARDHAHALLVAVAQHGGDLLGRVGQHHGERHLAVGREAVGLVGLEARLVGDDAVAGDDGAQRGDDLLAAGEDLRLGGRQRDHGEVLRMAGRCASPAPGASAPLRRAAHRPHPFARGEQEATADEDSMDRSRARAGSGDAGTGPAAGRLRCRGTRRRRPAYSGTAMLENTGRNTWRVTWQVGPDTAQGVGLLIPEGPLFVVGYVVAGREIGVVAYAVEPDGRLRGTWTQGQGGGVGYETLTPAGGAARK